MDKSVRITVRSISTGESTEHQFTTSPVRVGRNRLNDLSLPYPFVSGWHAVIRFDDRKARFFDLGSTNGTLFEGQRVAVGQAVNIEPSATVVLGDLELIMSLGDMFEVPAISGVTQPGMTRGEWMQAPANSETVVASGEINQDGLGAVEAPPLDAHQTAHVPMRQIHAALAALRPYHEAQRQARLSFEQELRARLAMLPNFVRAQAEDFIRREFTPPGEAVAREASGKDAASPQSAGGVSSVAELAEQLLPDVPPPTASAEQQRFLSGVREVLETCAKGLIELQRGQEQFGREMGVKAIKEFTPLHVAGTAREVLAHLLDFRHSGPERTAQLTGLFADTMIHQVALLNGVAEGGRALLAHVDPDEIERDIRGWGSAPKKWERFVQLYRSITSDERALTEMLFGPEFARAYARVGGEQSAPGRETGEHQHDED